MRPGLAAPQGSSFLEPMLAAGRKDCLRQSILCHRIVMSTHAAYPESAPQLTSVAVVFDLIAVGVGNIERTLAAPAGDRHVAILEKFLRAFEHGWRDLEADMFEALIARCSGASFSRSSRDRRCPASSEISSLADGERRLSSRAGQRRILRSF